MNLDFLIDRNLEPKKGMEYIYMHHQAWSDEERCHIPLKYGSIVTNLVRLENNSIDFTYNNNRYKSNYGWAFAENTLENRAKIDKYLESNKKLDELKRETKRLRNDIVDLSPKK